MIIQKCIKKIQELKGLFKCDEIYRNVVTQVQAGKAKNVEML